MNVAVGNEVHTIWLSVHSFFRRPYLWFSV